MATKPHPHAFGKKDPLKTGLKEIRKEISEAQFKSLTSAVKAAWQNDTTSARDFGEALLALKNAFYQHGHFTKWLRTNGIHQNRASYCMRVAENKVKPAQQRHTTLPQTKAKRKIDELFKIIEAPFEPDMLAKALYEANMNLVAGVVGQLITELGWQIGKEIRPHTDPKWLAASQGLTNALREMWYTLLFLGEAEEAPLPALPPARERAIGKTLKAARKPKARAAAAGASAGSGYAP